MGEQSMWKGPHSLRSLACITVLVAAGGSAQTQAVASFRGMLAQDPEQQVFLLRTPMPLGAEGYRLKGTDKSFYLLACLEDNRFDGVRVSRVRGSESVMDAGGQPWHSYPSQLTFRVTATAMTDILTNLDTSEVEEPGDVNSIFLGLRFRLKVYHELEMRTVDPTSARLIGVPADTPYDERIFRVSFDTKDLPLDDRLVLEVLAPSGQLLSRFHLELL